MDISEWNFAKREYNTYQSAIRGYLPDALNDPIIALAVAQIEMAYLAIDARMQEISGNDEP